ncbi:MAG: N-acetylmuramoyl-L-alanine amidase [Coriobacteriales bacterium]
MLRKAAIGSWARDYGMISRSIGIELVHVGNAAYPRAQLKAFDRLIKYIDTYYGFDSIIIDHKAWRLAPAARLVSYVFRWKSCRVLHEPIVLTRSRRRRR